MSMWNFFFCEMFNSSPRVSYRVRLSSIYLRLYCYCSSPASIVHSYFLGSFRIKQSGSNQQGMKTTRLMKKNRNSSSFIMTTFISSLVYFDRAREREWVTQLMSGWLVGWGIRLNWTIGGIFSSVCLHFKEMYSLPMDYFLVHFRRLISKKRHKIVQGYPRMQKELDFSLLFH